MSSKITRDEVNSIVDKIIQAGWDIDQKYAKEYNLNLEASLNIGHRHHVRLLSLFEEYFEISE